MSSQPASLTPFDIWLLARLCAGFTLNGEINRASGSIRPLVERMGEVSVEERASIWEEYLTDLPEEAAGAFLQAVAEANPGDPAPEDDGWGAPELEKPVGVELFPVDVYPAAVERLIREGSNSIGCAPDLFGLAILAAAGSAIGRSTSLRLKDNYFATTAFYVANIGVPGDGKSPALDEVLRPLRQIDDEEYKRYKSEMTEYEAASDAYDEARRLSRFRASPPKSRRNKSQELDELDDDDGSQASECLPDPIPPARPVLRRVVVDDATTESLALILADNPRGVLVGKDELTALMGSMNQYRSGKGSDRQFFLSAWSGAAIVVDRKGNVGREPVRVQHPHLGIVGGMPPAMLGDLAEGRGRDDGFIDRMLFAYPDPAPKAGWRDDGTSEEARKGWVEIIKALRGRPLVITEGEERPWVVNLTPSAKTLWRDWYDSHHAEQNADDFPDWLRGPWAKLEQYAGRITLVLHMLHWAADPFRSESVVSDVGPRSVRDAVRLVRYLKSHLRRVHSAMRVKSKGNDGGEFAQTILRWVRRNRRESFSERDLTRNYPRLGERPRELQAALAWLELRNCLRRKQVEVAPGRPGRKPSPVFDVNPRLIPALEGRESATRSLDDRPGSRSVNSVENAAETEGDDVRS